ncbi:hypothetical protein PAEAM_39720 [Paenibacillus sp. GM1FR]|nr:hypothetical protein PAEAM_39720 [Paenibacillus sp. GM1FR]
MSVRRLDSTKPIIEIIWEGIVLLNMSNKRIQKFRE